MEYTIKKVLGTGYEWHQTGTDLCRWCKFNRLWYQNNRRKRSVLLNACKNIGLAVNTRKTKYNEVGRHTSVRANEHIMIRSILMKKWTFKHLISLLVNQNSIHEQIKCGLKAGELCYFYSKHFFLDFSLRVWKSKYITMISPSLLYGFDRWCYIEGRIWAQDFWKLDPEANIWAQGTEM